MNRKKGVTMAVLAAALMVSTVGMMSAEMIGGHNITFVNHTYDGDISTWYYNVTTGSEHDLSNWIICWCNGSAVVECPDSNCDDWGVYEGNNPHTVWKQGIKFENGIYTGVNRTVWFKLYGVYLPGLINVSTKASGDVAYGAITGPMDSVYCPGCIVPELSPSILISAGLLILVGCVAMRRKD
jgi:hypothetical protein